MNSTRNYLESSKFLIKTESELEQKPTLQNINNEESKCGEIFVTFDGAFQVYCKFCNKKFYKVPNFINHIINIHLCLKTNSYLNDFLTDAPEIQENNVNSEIVDGSNELNRNVDLTKVNNKLNSDTEDEMSGDVKLVNKNKEKTTENILNLGQNSNNTNNFSQNSADESDTDNQLAYETNIKKELPSKYKCTICPRKLKFKGALTRHINLHMKNDGRPKKKYESKRNYVCEICGVSYRSNFFLKEHLRVHSGERPHKCDLCPQAFAKRAHLSFHVRYHLNDRRFKCQYCDKAFVESTKRKLHEMIHTNDFPFECEFCEKKFRCRSKLNVHVKRHINDRIYKCDLCDKRFFDINLLKGHQAVHSDDKPFACEVCPARFPRKGALRLHMQLHLEAKSYVCKVCGKTFAQYNGIYSHMKSHGIKYSSAYERGEIEGKEATLPNNKPIDNNENMMMS